MKRMEKVEGLLEKFKEATKNVNFGMIKDYKLETGLREGSVCWYEHVNDDVVIQKIHGVCLDCNGVIDIVVECKMNDGTLIHPLLSSLV